MSEILANLLPTTFREERVKHETLHRLRMAEQSDEQWGMMEMRESPMGWAEIEQVSSVTGEVVSKKK